MLYVTHDQVEAMTMSDNLVVMRGGLVEQVGTPLEVFSRPATAYVANFLGNMNVVALDKPNGIVASPTTLTRGDAMTIGIRPEHLRLETGDTVPLDRVVIEGQVFLDELHGTDRVLHVRAGDVVWRARLDSALTFGETVRISANSDNVHLYDTNGTRCAA